MKCPKCGFVSFPDLRECRKCGTRFDLSEEEPAPARDLEPSQSTTSFAVSDPSGELSERVAGFRRRRATLRENDGRELSLAFDFSTPAGPMPPSGAAENISATSSAEQIFDRAFAERAVSSSRAKLESIPLDRHPENSRSNTFAGHFTIPATQDTRSASFAEAPFSFQDIPAELEFPEVSCAPLAARFAAGLIDSLLLLAGGCLFAALFVAVGGRFDKTPFDLSVALFIAAFWLFVYCAAFGVMTQRTPGQAALGLEIRSLSGEPPTVTESLLRAFGVLVSISALALGFLWAALDSDGMSWQDHISGTVLSSVKRAE